MVLPPRRQVRVSDGASNRLCTTEPRPTPGPVSHASIIAVSDLQVDRCTAAAVVVILPPAGRAYVHDAELNGDEDLAIGMRVEVQDASGRVFAAVLTGRTDPRWQLGYG